MLQTGLTVPRGDPGELCTRGYTRDARLLERAREDRRGRSTRRGGCTRATWRRWTTTATSNIIGRIKDMVIRGGENVYPREVEEFLYTHPDIQDAQVIGVPDEKYGEELMAWVRMRPGAEPLTAESLRAYCAGQLAHYKVPRYVHVVDEFPMTVTGKVRKVEMRARAVEILGLD